MRRKRKSRKSKSVCADLPAAAAGVSGAEVVETRSPAELPMMAGGATPNWDASVSDTVVLGGRCAANEAERHVTLDHAVGNSWATEDIGKVWRVESGGRCLWVMTRRTSTPPE